MLRITTIRPNLLIALACAALMTAGCGGKSSTGAVCGDGVIEGNEVCDDGNTIDGDGCSSTCTVEGAECGNGIIETGEECDDANTDNGDGCSSVCSLEVAPGCGNGVVEIGEGCDDGNTDSCDGCSATCSLELCGNGLTECDEECDDGNTTNGDGCDADCMVETGGCGNGTIDAGEECDDGNTVSGDGCDSDCMLEVMPGCGNGVVEVGEECDDGNLDDCDGCSATCTVEACGNGVVECTEQCDDGNTISGDGCSATCQSEVTPICGNGAVETGEDCDDGNASNADACLNNCTNASCGDTYIWAGIEACDDGNTASGDGCSATCQLEACGNGVVDAGEGCDDGNGINTDDCPDGVGGTCQPAVCGDGFVHATFEECDDGNTTSGDGCSATCTSEGPECTVAWTLICGDSDSWNNSAFGSTDVIDTHGCIGWDESGPEYTYEFVATANEDVTVGLSAMTADLDIFVIDDLGGVCDPTNCLDVGGNSVTFAAVAGTTYYFVVDGYQGAVSDYTIAVVCPSTPGCGNGIVEGTEQCDDGNFDDTDACVTGCVNATCGDGFVQSGVEECDDGNAIDTDGCRNNCLVPACGDGILDTGEQCDDGNTDDGDGCSSSCTPENCHDDYTLTCGGTDTYNNSLGGSWNVLTTYSCVGWDESGPEYSYLFSSTTDQTVTVDLSVLTAGEDLDVFVISDNGGLCEPTGCLTYGEDQAVFAAAAGVDYYIVVDGYQGSVADYTIDLSCATLPACGDFTVDYGEECDDGNTTNGDGCDANCEFEGVICTPSWWLDCGDTDTWNNNGGGHTNNTSSYSCNAWNESGPEYTYLFLPANSGDVTVDLSGMTGDLDVYVLSDTAMECDPANCVDYGETSVTFAATAGATYYIVVDGYNGAISNYTIDMSCTNP
jgi:cysteine-rich repeat protein